MYPSAAGDIRYRWAVGSTRWGRDVVEWVYLDDSNSANQSQIVQAGLGPGLALGD